MDIYKTTINETEYLYKCICHKDWHDLQSIMLTLVPKSQDPTTTPEEIDALREQVDALQRKIVVKYTVEPHIDDGQIDDMDESVYNQLIILITERAAPKNSRLGIEPT